MLHQQCVPCSGPVMEQIFYRESNPVLLGWVKSPLSLALEEDAEGRACPLPSVWLTLSPQAPWVGAPWRRLPPLAGRVRSLQDAGLPFSACVSAVLCVTHGGGSWKFLFEGGQGLLGVGDESNWLSFLCPPISLQRKSRTQSPCPTPCPTRWCMESTGPGSTSAVCHRPSRPSLAVTQKPEQQTRTLP